MVPSGVVLSRGAFRLALFSCLDCSSTPRSGSRSCQPRNYSGRPGKRHCFICPVSPCPPTHPLEWLLKCKYILGKHEVNVKLRKLLLWEVQKYGTTSTSRCWGGVSGKTGEIPLVFESCKQPPVARRSFRGQEEPVGFFSYHLPKDITWWNFSAWHLCWGWGLCHLWWSRPVWSTGYFWHIVSTLLSMVYWTFAGIIHTRTSIYSVLALCCVLY